MSYDIVVTTLSYDIVVGVVIARWIRLMPLVHLTVTYTKHTTSKRFPSPTVRTTDYGEPIWCTPIQTRKLKPNQYLTTSQLSIYSLPRKNVWERYRGNCWITEITKKIPDINSHYPPTLTVTKRLRNGYDTTTTRQRHDNDIVERHGRNYDISNLA